MFFLTLWYLISCKKRGRTIHKLTNGIMVFSPSTQITTKRKITGSGDDFSSELSNDSSNDERFDSLNIQSCSHCGKWKWIKQDIDIYKQFLCKKKKKTLSLCFFFVCCIANFYFLLFFSPVYAYNCIIYGSENEQLDYIYGQYDWLKKFFCFVFCLFHNKIYKKHTHDLCWPWHCVKNLCSYCGTNGLCFS